MPCVSALRTESLLDLEQTIAAQLLTQYEYPWQALQGIHDFILALGPTLSEDVYVRQAGTDIWIAKTATVAPTACLNGPLIIGERAEIRHCAYIRGNALVGDDAVVGNSTELKNVILFNKVQVPHFNYVGDSILGYRAHMGAGSITSNVKSDKMPVVLHFAEERIETGLKKFGAILGDNVEIGCNTVMNPGSVVGRGSIVYPVTMIRGYVPQDSIVKDCHCIVPRQDR